MIWVNHVFQEKERPLKMEEKWEIISYWLIKWFEISQILRYLKLVASEGKGVGAVAIRGVALDLGEVRDTEVNIKVGARGRGLAWKEKKRKEKKRKEKKRRERKEKKRKEN